MSDEGHYPQSRAEMHRVWGIPEIVGLVLAELNPTLDNGAGDFAALARTSTIFHNTALDALWSHLDSIRHLFRCMPADLWERVSTGQPFDSILRPTRDIVKSDWDRLLKHAARVKSLDCHHMLEHDLTPFYEVLLHWFSESPLLPKLEHLSWNHWHDNHLGYIDPLLGPQLKSIDIVYHSPRSSHYSILANLSRKCTTLSSVFVSPGFEDGSDGVITTQLCDFVGGLIQVQVLEVGTLNLAALTHLGGLKTLETLKARLPPALVFSENQYQTMFSNLYDATLEVERGDISSLEAFVRTWKRPPLVSFEVAFHGVVSPARIGDFHDLLSTHCVPDCLEVFKFDSSCEEEDGTGGFIYPGAFLRSLLCFTNLTTIWITVLDGFSIDDALVSDLAQAWPYLEQLRLITDAHDAPPRATLLALQALAQHCPNLTTLEMTFDATTVAPPPAVIFDPRIMQASLVTLGAGFSHIAAAFPVARFLSGIFVNLRAVTTSRGLGGGHMHVAQAQSEYYRRWREVTDLLPGLVAIREEEWQHGRKTTWEAVTSAMAAIAVEKNLV
ncbi:hypothetical protein C8R43DRAFT_994750 [Mycena crocata]|nr:hypothetical protein C8R43DRAFT_994750 [Mycena crocata]